MITETPAGGLTTKWANTMYLEMDYEEGDTCTCSHVQCNHVLLTGSDDNVIVSAVNDHAPHGWMRRFTSAFWTIYSELFGQDFWQHFQEVSVYKTVHLNKCSSIYFFPWSERNANFDRFVSEIKAQRVTLTIAVKCFLFCFLVVAFKPVLCTSSYHYQFQIRAGGVTGPQNVP